MIAHSHDHTPSPAIVATIPRRARSTHILTVAAEAKRGYVANIGSGSVSAAPSNAQVLAPDATQSGLPVALSNGRQSQTPPTRGGTAPTKFRRTYSTTSSSAATGITPTSSAVITRLTY